VCLGDTVRKGRQPSVWLPFVSVWTPDVWIPVGPDNGRHYVRVSGYDDLTDLGTVFTDDRFEQRKNHILASAD
jgi:hypothetical protein